MRIARSKRSFTMSTASAERCSSIASRGWRAWKSGSTGTMCIGAKVVGAATLSTPWGVAWNCAALAAAASASATILTAWR